LQKMRMQFQREELPDSSSRTFRRAPCILVQDAKDGDFKRLLRKGKQ
jgi:hypothetical protein